MDTVDDYANYPEVKLRNRFKLAYDWIPNNTFRLLDGGCAYGYGTKFFARKAKETYGVDPNNELVDIAKKRYKYIKFYKSGLENMPFKDNFFDVVVMTDVIEHVENEVKAFSEIYRVLKKGGCLIITSPYKGLFSFMDVENYPYFVRTKLPWIYRLLKKGEKRISKPGYERGKHKHYFIKDIIRLLDCSSFKGNYLIKKNFRYGLIMGPLIGNLNLFLSLFFNRKIREIILEPLYLLLELEYRFSFGVFATDFALKIVKT
jgi:ubiquinone/menaquinone biosynthesis C-methylase UbiE